MNTVQLCRLSLAFIALLIGRATAAESPPKLPVPPPSSITHVAPDSFFLGPPGHPRRWFDDNLQVNSNPATLTRPQVEPSVASNPKNAFQLVVGFADTLDDPIA